METTTIITKNARETQRAGQFLAEELLKEKIEKDATVIALEGDLGGGKTTFTQGMIGGLGISEEITSPTFVILKKYEIPVNGQRLKFFYHLDCYRLNNEQDILDLDFKQLIGNPENLVVIEWAEKIKKILPQDTILIKFEYLGQDERQIEINL